ncbi:nephrocystin-4-like isoform X2 [Halichondria panicea]|uniref:nephrocystin-4-like isoform X2 n=1 Tax=Halichondria panicea TaxID=6063 RepID=UPI00312B9879
MSLKGGSSDQKSFQLAYRSLEGYANLLGRKVEKQTSVHLAEYKFRTCIFNNAYKRFEGRFYDSMPCRLVESLKTGAVMCPIEQVAFFYCNGSDPTLILVIELTALFHSDSVKHQICLGWSMFPLFDRRVNVTRGGKSPSHNTVRLALYEGSPRALFSLTHPTGEDKKELVPIPGCILTCSLCPHPTLLKATSFIPPNTLISLDDHVPGLAHTNVLEAFPKLLKTSSGTFEKVSLLLLPSVEDFEELLLSAISEDLASGGIDSDATRVAIEERRLKVMPYNGWRYNSSAAIGYLERGSPTTGKVSSSLRGSTFGVRDSLVLKGSLEVSDLIVHADTEVVFQLEYVVSWSRAAIFQTPTRDTLSRRATSKTTDKPSTTHSTTLTLAWAVWNPEAEQNTSVSLELKRGCGFKPTLIPSSAHSVCYQGNLSDAGKLTFKFTPSRSSSRMEGSQTLTTTSGVQFEDMKSPRHMPNGGRDLADSGRPPSTPPHVRSSPVPIVTTPTRTSSKPLHSVEILGTAEPHVTTPPHHISAGHVPRSVLAYFHNAGIEEFKDKKGNSLPTITPHSAAKATIDPSVDVLSDSPLVLAVQILGHTLSDDQPSPQHSVSLTLHCPLFSTVVVHCSCAPPPSGSSTQLPHLLSPLDSDGTHAGITHCYHANHTTLPSKTDHSDFSSLLSSGCLIIDLYDRDSLFLLGTARLPLRTLLSSPDNPSPSYCQSHLSLPLRLSAHTTDTSLTTLTPSHTTPSSSQTGTLYVRIARLPPELDRIAKMENLNKGTKRMCTIARRLYSNHTHLKEEQQCHDEDEQTRKRKFDRMQRVREMKAMENENKSFMVESNKPFPSNQSDVIDLQREELKRERISAVLQESVTTSYRLRVRMGRVVYFEHPFTNSQTNPVTVSVAWNDPELKLVVDRQEVNCLRQHFSIHTIMDDNLLSEGLVAGQYEFFVHPGETVHLPFKYLTFRSCPQTTPCDSGDVGGETNGEQYASRRKSIKVYLQAAHQEVLAILNVQVEPLPPRLDQLLHFYHSEKSFLKKQLSLSLSGGDVFVCCSEPEAVCEVKHSSNSGSVFIKVPVQSSPALSTLYIIIYYDQKYLISPSQVWKLCIHSVQRVDHSLQVGQSSQVKLMLRGDHTDRRVACYSCNQHAVRILTPTPFLLSSQSLTEFPVTLHTLFPGTSTLLVSAVDVDNKMAIGQWLVVSESHLPSISRGFQISLPTGGGELMRKTISFTNPYPKKKSFHLSTNRPDVVQFDSILIKLHAQETVVLNLNFSPHHSRATVDVYIFINDNKDLTEECFLVKTIYS